LRARVNLVAARNARNQVAAFALRPARTWFRCAVTQVRDDGAVKIEGVESLRAIAASVGPAAPAMEPYLTKVRTRAYTVVDADIEQLTAAGISEDEIFEQTVATAIREGMRRYDAATEAIG
jgi:alkylhydroperoxidase family enzyme